MPRPMTDLDATRNDLLELCEQIIRERGAISFTMTDLAAMAGMSQSNIYRFFESKEAVYEAMAERWFAELTDIMVDVTESDLPVPEKLFQYFARRLAVKRARYEAEPALFDSYIELGDEHFEVIRGYVDMGDHYLAIIVAEAMAEGYFEGLTIDLTVSLINLMVQPFCNPRLLPHVMHSANEAKLRLAIGTLLRGLKDETGTVDAQVVQSMHAMPMRLAN